MLKVLKSKGRIWICAKFPFINFSSNFDLLYFNMIFIYGFDLHCLSFGSNLGCSNEGPKPFSNGDNKE